MRPRCHFQNNRSNAIRLPKAVAFADNVKRVDLVVLGKTRIITPAGSPWESGFDGSGVTADFMLEREQSAEQYRGIILKGNRKRRLASLTLGSLPMCSTALCASNAG
ncbi:type II toxin-antitoxin system VapB family antitoxin [Duganella phyllosphaerae]|uniref:type II toxin-antitoxin system VapB family antitoxin n=1 Tax=Duganella phyllosphaerae TaxID=762836 RepID=UPI00114CF405|nr:type II toxin-antitoxin system VapB family antitoxin [Duganella phyllosphaerae]